MIRIQNFNFIIWKFLQMSKLLYNILKISGGDKRPPGCAPDAEYNTLGDNALHAHTNTNTDQ